MANITIPPRPPLNATQPGVYSAVDASALSGAGVVPTAPIVAVPGSCKGGPPNTALYFRDSQALRNVLRSGPAYDVARFAMRVGSQPVVVVRTGSGITQSTKNLAGASGTGIVLTSIDYGSWTTGIQVTVTANNTVTITVTDRLGVTYNEVFSAGAGATAADVANLINGGVIGVSASLYVTAVAGAGTMPLATASVTSLTGGSDGSLSGGDWTTALTVLEPETVNLVVPATGDATVHAQVQTHCDNMSTTLARKERTGVYGAVLGESVSAQATRMASLRNKRSQLIYPGFVDFNDAGVLKSWDPFYLAGLVAGVHSVLPDEATPLTHTRLPIIDVEKQLSPVQGSDLDQLLVAGVTPVGRAEGTGFWVVDSLSGYNTDDVFRDYHKVRSVDAVARKLRARLEEDFVGEKSLLNTGEDIKRVADSQLDQYKVSGLIRDFSPTTVSQVAGNAKTYNVTVPIMPVDTTKFIYLTIALQPSSTLLAQPAVAPDANA